MADLKTQINCLAYRIDVSQEKVDAWRKETMAYQEVMEACLEKTMAGLEETEAVMDVFKEKLHKMDTTDLEANREKSEAVVVHQWKLGEHWRIDVGTGIWP
jgi:hypothetical protein